MKHNGGANYSGSLWADFGPFPIDVLRDGSVLKGTVTYGGAAHALQIESTSKGMILTEDGKRVEAPLKHYASMEEFQKSVSAQGGYQATGVTYDPAATQPAR